MTNPGFRKRLLDADKLIETPWIRDAHPFRRMNPKPLKKPLRVVVIKPSKLHQNRQIGSGAPPGAAKSVKRPQTTPDKYQQLMARDGINCWLCHEPLGADRTIEHLCASANGGPNHMSNYVLTHQACNCELGTKSIAEKVRMREARRDPPAR